MEIVNSFYFANAFSLNLFAFPLVLEDPGGFSKVRETERTGLDAAELWRKRKQVNI